MLEDPITLETVLTPRSLQNLFSSLESAPLSPWYAELEAIHRLLPDATWERLCAEYHERSKQLEAGCWHNPWEALQQARLTRAGWHNMIRFHNIRSHYLNRRQRERPHMTPEESDAEALATLPLLLSKFTEEERAFYSDIGLELSSPLVAARRRDKSS
ncbi:hypothetical protein BCR35DRAFT_305173 [Leucosporidium creatinivorum]|uniref:Uncharacterized protein n=1 Tax=Leucosporidium creatinivorum TaxID=106004 RepID=A0A1Y2F502_9BASI|nr:hypothetical protein BCR35DRAFT_305173 [Leucosporidium creatinivorum]